MKPACISTWCDDRKHFPAFMETARRHGITPLNADPGLWPGRNWREIPWWRKSEAQARFVREHAGEYTHFLFCDAYDILFAAGWDEILRKYEALKSPIVFGTERFCWPKPESARLYPPSPYKTRFLNAGMWLATTEYALKLAEVLAARARENADPARIEKQCDSGICVDLFLSRQLPIELDRTCSLLYCCNLDSLDHLAFDQGRIKAVETGENPCLFHGNGDAPIQRLYPWLNLELPPPKI
jgi:hypothetical protein